MRTRIMNQLQALAMNEGQRRKKKLWSGSYRCDAQRGRPAGKGKAEPRVVAAVYVSGLRPHRN